MPCGWIFTYIGNWRSPKVAKIMVVHWYFTFFTVRSILLPYAFVLEKYSEFQTTSSRASGPVFFWWLGEKKMKSNLLSKAITEHMRISIKSQWLTYFYMYHNYWSIQTPELLNFLILKAPYSSKIDIFFIQERFNKLIYSINTILKCGIWQPVKFKLVSRFWTGSKMNWFFIVSLN